MSLKSKGGRDPIYDPVLKVAIGREYLTSALGYGKLAKKHGLKVSTVSFFVRWYKAHYEQLPLSGPQEQGVVTRQGKEDTSAMQQRDKELKQANLKITALEMLIENASKELGMDLAKKFGTKQPKK